MQPNSLRLFRLLGIIEGTSLIVLLFIAMPLKYMADLPEVVTVVGSLHGFFFVLYILMIAFLTFKIRWAFKWVFSSVLVAFIPFGNYVLDYKLQRSYLR
ncbi:DUF3817 domain-containing protein [Sediminibacillus massiliensis]|uniref:DUF3817 domain-containing protein n=1 Tax=Sediminibacillus massiliensis TaxID=1926277 RepID=UPI0009884927|nr:DUF3817 domain-containing protein [Sediminibacillus massiliensis]